MFSIQNMHQKAKIGSPPLAAELLDSIKTLIKWSQSRFDGGLDEKDLMKLTHAQQADLQSLTEWDLLSESVKLESIDIGEALHDKTLSALKDISCASNFTLDGKLNKYNSLEWAAKNNAATIFNAFFATLGKPIMKNETHYLGYTLRAACEQGHLNIINILLAAGADVNVQENGWSPLGTAAANGHHNIVKLLLAVGARVTTFDPFSSRTLTTTASNGHIEIMQLLLKHTQEINDYGYSGKTPLTEACNKGHTDMVKLLLYSGAETETKAQCKPIIMAARKGFIDIVKMLIRKNANIDIIDHWGLTALIVAAENGHTEIVRILIKAGANVHTIDNEGATALMLAQRNGHQGAVTEILMHPKYLIKIPSLIEQTSGTEATDGLIIYRSPQATIFISTQYGGFIADIVTRNRYDAEEIKLRIKEPSVIVDDIELLSTFSCTVDGKRVSMVHFSQQRAIQLLIIYLYRHDRKHCIASAEIMDKFNLNHALLKARPTPDEFGSSINLDKLIHALHHAFLCIRHEKLEISLSMMFAYAARLGHETRQDTTEIQLNKTQVSSTLGGKTSPILEEVDGQSEDNDIPMVDMLPRTTDPVRFLPDPFSTLHIPMYLSTSAFLYDCPLGSDLINKDPVLPAPAFVIRLPIPTNGGGQAIVELTHIAPKSWSSCSTATFLPSLNNAASSPKYMSTADLVESTDLSTDEMKKNICSKIQLEHQSDTQGNHLEQNKVTALLRKI